MNGWPGLPTGCSSGTLARTSSLYGVFGIVLGLLAWLYLQAQITVLAIEIGLAEAPGLACPSGNAPRDRGPELPA